MAKRCCCNRLSQYYSTVNEFKKIIQQDHVIVYLYPITKQVGPNLLNDDDDHLILFNNSDSIVRRPFRSVKLNEGGLNSLHCQTIMNKVKNLLNELGSIEAYQAIGVCKHCLNTKTVTCPKCVAIIGKFVETRKTEIEEYNKRHDDWLMKIKQLLYEIMEKNEIYQHENEGLKSILKQLQEAMLWYQARMAHEDNEILNYLISLNTKMWEQIINNKRSCGRICRNRSFYRTTNICDLRQKSMLLNAEITELIKQEEPLLQSHEDGPNCVYCQTVMNRVLNVLMEFGSIKRYQAIGVCKHCLNTRNITCQKCNALIGKSVETRKTGIEEYNKRHDDWLIRMKQLLYEIMEKDDIYQCIINENEGLKSILKQLQEALLWYRSRMEHKDDETLNDLISLNAKMWEQIMNNKRRSGRFGGSFYKCSTICDLKQKSMLLNAEITKLMKENAALLQSKDTCKTKKKEIEISNKAKAQKKEVIEKKKSPEDNKIEKPVKITKEKRISVHDEQKKQQVQKKVIVREEKVDNKQNLLSKSEISKENAPEELTKKTELMEPQTMTFPEEKEKPKAPQDIKDENNISIENVPEKFIKKIELQEEEEVTPKAPQERIVREEIIDTTLTQKAHRPSKLQKDRRWIIKYRLSNPEYIKKKWTVMPIAKTVQKINIYKTKPIHNWFTLRQNRPELFYDSGEILAKTRFGHSGNWFYRNGSIALSYYRDHDRDDDDDDDEHVDIYEVFNCITNGDKIKSKMKLHSEKPIAVFDSIGNGVVYDVNGKVRLQYNQFEVWILDPKIGPPSHWIWNKFHVPPIIKHIWYSPTLKAEVWNPKHFTESSTNLQTPLVPPETQSPSEVPVPKKYRPLEMRMKAFKINDYFSLKILSQFQVYLCYRDGRNSLKINMGVHLDTNTILRTETVDYKDKIESY